MKQLNLENYKGIIFDLDGVIYDITGAIKKAVEDVVEKYKMNVDKNEIMQEIAHLIENLQNYPVPEIILNSFDLLKVNFMQGMSYFKKLRIGIYLFTQFNKYKDAESTLFSGMDNLIEYLSKRKIKLAILTNNKSTYAEEVLQKYNLSKYFNCIVGFNDVSETKPNPEGIYLILKRWKMKPKDIIFIGDMTSDVDAGKTSKVMTICVASGLAQKIDLQNHNPDILVENTDELIKLFHQ
jgi:HAD superfamily hydrolase (TIGR01549 family)